MIHKMAHDDMVMSDDVIRKNKKEKRFFPFYYVVVNEIVGYIKHCMDYKKCNVIFFLFLVFKYLSF